jgi:general nucleoside transport system permease protein
MTVTVDVFTVGVTLLAPILWAALGEIIVEQSGVINIGIEGVMLISAMASAIGYRYTGNLYVGLPTAIGAGLVCGVVLAALYVRIGTDQIVTGILFNVLALGLTTAIYIKYLGTGNEVPATIPNLKIPGLGDIPWLGKILFTQNFLVYAGFLAVPVVFYVLHQTWFGLYARAAAENPRVVEAAGLDVRRLRYPAVIFGCTLTAVAGATLVLSSSGQFVTNLTAGRGYIALAVVVLARWNPFAAIAASLLFGIAQALQFQVQNLGPLAHVPSDFVLMFPYAVTIVAVIFARASRYPAACGIPWVPTRKRAT